MSLTRKGAQTHWLVDLLPFPAAVLDHAASFLHANIAWRSLADTVRGPAPHDSVSLHFDERDPGFAPGLREAPEIVAGVRAVARGERGRFEADHAGPEIAGQQTWFRLAAVAAKDVLPPVTLLVRTDSSELHVEQERQRILELAVERSSDLVFWLDRAGRLVFANDRLCRVLGYARNELLELSVWDIDPFHVARDWPQHLRELRDLGTLIYRSSHLTRDGVTFPVEVSSHYVQVGHRELVFVYSREPALEPTSGSFRFRRKVEERTSELSEANRRLQQEIESHQRTEAALRESQQRLELALGGTNLGLWDWDVTSERLTFDRRWAAMVGCEVEDLPARFEGWTGLTHPDDVAALRRALDDHLHGLTDVFEVAHRMRHRDGEYRWFLGRGKVAERGPEGGALRVTGTLQDITDRRRLEDQLLQSQKMEAVGQLAGGVAHDFNNLLTAINGYADLVLRALEPSNPLHAKVAEIRKSGDRAATLTDRLLAFSRKQVQQPRLLDLNAVIESMGSLLAPAIGEGIEMITELDPELPLVRADPGQMEQVLLNLVVNARDAMNGGGQVTVRTTRVDPKELKGVAGATQSLRPEYVGISVTDTGCGIEPQHLAHVFEPFFTTKERGRGTGLGLSMVYGIVTQSSGFIELKSQPGRGTAVQIYLPAAARAAGDSSSPGTDEATGTLGGNERILLVEDEQSVRDLVTSSLRAEGYQVLATDCAEEARALMAGEVFAPDLLLTDVMLPGQNGAELATELRRQDPGLKVLFVSGYARDVLGRAQILSRGVHFVQKPFTLVALLRRVRAILDRGVPA